MRLTARWRCQSSTVELLDAGEAHDAGAVDHHVEPAVSLDHRRHRLGHRGRIGHVGGQHVGAVAGQIGAHDRGPLAREQPGGGRADARGGAGHQGDPAVEPAHRGAGQSV